MKSSDHARINAMGHSGAVRQSANHVQSYHGPQALLAFSAMATARRIVTSPQIFHRQLVVSNQSKLINAQSFGPIVQKLE
jgi:hypothetical protein